MRHVYLDWNATTPPLPEILEAMRDAAMTTWANPASVHRPGQRARAELDRARRAVAELVGFHPRDVLLTGGGTEANNLALRSVEGPLYLSRLEHPSVVRVAERLREEGRAIHWIDVRSDGRLDADHLAGLLVDTSPGGGLVCVQAVNHETGVLQPVALAADLAHRAGALLHCDAVQAVGRLGADSWSGADSVTVAAHKLRGPKGIGALVTRPGLTLRAVLRGGDQERGLRPGTQDASLAVGLRCAAERALDGHERYGRLEPLRDRFEAAATALGVRFGVQVLRNGEASRAPHVSNLSFLGWRSPELAAALDLEGVAVSSGAACSAGTAAPSPVVGAMTGAGRADTAVRFSFGEETTEAEVASALGALERIFERRSLLEST
ncbi:MAG: cysteine desulfurase [Deltaproteobacteria bacterium]|nr:cysteine desulfurase [Deltaproteobacteria bacterium]